MSSKLKYHILHVDLNGKTCRLAFAYEQAAKNQRDVLVRSGFTVVREEHDRMPQRSPEEADLAVRLSNLIVQKLRCQTYNSKGQFC